MWCRKGRSSGNLAIQVAAPDLICILRCWCTASLNAADGPAADQLALSPEIRMLQAAAGAALAAPEIRPEVVARMRDLLADGQLGADVSRLADAIVDNWLHGL